MDDLGIFDNFQFLEILKSGKDVVHVGIAGGAVTSHLEHHSVDDWGADGVDSVDGVNERQVIILELVEVLDSQIVHHMADWHQGGTEKGTGAGGREVSQGDGCESKEAEDG